MDDENDNAQSEIEIIPRFSRDLRNVCTIQAYVASSTSAPANAIYNFSSNCLPTPSGPVRNLTRYEEERREEKRDKRLSVAVGARTAVWPTSRPRGPCCAACLLAAQPPSSLFPSLPPSLTHLLFLALRSPVTVATATPGRSSEGVRDEARSASIRMVSRSLFTCEWTDFKSGNFLW